ncbi:MAG: hypothetical protein AB7T49_18920 [Oligoflexales bacterium]
MKRWNVMLGAVVVVFALFQASNANSQTRSQVYGSDLDRQTMTAYFQGDVGMMTVESDAVNSKQTLNTTSWEFGGYAGEARKLGFAFQATDNDVDFALNKSHMETSWRDAMVQGRIGWVYPRITAGLTRIQIDQDGEEVVNLYGPSVGAGCGVYVPLWDRIVVSADYNVHQTQNAQNSTDHDVSMGKRKDGQVAVSVDVTDRMIDLMFGFRHRSYDLTVDGQNNNETTQGAFIGTRIGFYF